VEVKMLPRSDSSSAATKWRAYAGLALFAVAVLLLAALAATGNAGMLPAVQAFEIPPFAIDGP
jgi:hypothetical protein